MFIRIEKNSDPRLLAYFLRAKAQNREKAARDAAVLRCGWRNYFQIASFGFFVIFG